MRPALLRGGEICDGFSNQLREPLGGDILERAGVTMDEVGSASGVLEATQQLSTSLGVAVLGTIFFSAFGAHLATDALQITAWACLAPLATAFLLIFRLPLHARDEQEQSVALPPPGATSPGGWEY